MHHAIQTSDGSDRDDLEQFYRTIGVPSPPGTGIIRRVETDLEEDDGDSEYVNLYDMASDYGRSSLDQPINETLSLVWDLPFGIGRTFGNSIPRALDTALGGWQMTAINTATSGQPVNLTYSPSAAYTLSPLLVQRPNVSGNPINPSSKWIKTATALDDYLSSTNVTTPTNPAQAYGNAGRNSLRDMTFNELDLGLHKAFRLWSEKSNLDIRGEAFNLFNHVNYEAPNSSSNSSSFGSITSFFPPRQLQVAAKLSF